MRCFPVFRSGWWLSLIDATRDASHAERTASAPPVQIRQRDGRRSVDCERMCHFRSTVEMIQLRQVAFPIELGGSLTVLAVQ